jgi:serine phosphatase RsbU (regulator of sigma subunit)
MTVAPTSVAPKPHPLREAALIAVVGVIVGLTLSFGSPWQQLFKTVSLSVITSLTIYFTTRLASRLVNRIRGAGRRDQPWPRLLLGATLLFCAVIAWAVMILVGWLIFGISWRKGELLNSLFISACLAIAVGFAFSAFSRLKSRLAESVAKLKETEFATRELETARALQNRLLPPPEIEGEGYTVAARNRAALVVAGDFYDVFRLADGSLGVVVADVAGKGMAAALIMASVKAMLPLIAVSRSAAETLQALNERLAQELSKREFVALAYARFEPRTGRLSLANAGLPDPYRLATGQAPLPLVVPGPRLPLGARRGLAYESLDTVLAPGERLLLLTDGLAEAPLPSGGPLGYEGLAAVLTDVPNETPLAWIDRVFARLEALTVQPAPDDWTALVLERVAAPA